MAGAAGILLQLLILVLWLGVASAILVDGKRDHKPLNTIVSVVMIFVGLCLSSGLVVTLFDIRQLHRLTPDQVTGIVIGNTQMVRQDDIVGCIRELRGTRFFFITGHLAGAQSLPVTINLRS